MMRIIWVLCFIVSGFYVHAQDTDTVRSISDHTPPKNAEKKLSASLLIVGGYGVSLTDSVGFNEMHSLKDSVVNNTFYLRYVRLSARYQLTEKLEAGVLANLADFKSNPQNKVLENAFIRYKMNDFINLQFGQFRPFFGIEDMYAFEQHKSYSWSNQYNLFNKNNWMSFQLGASLFGSLKSINVPLKYYFTIYNGNGKNMDFDNDNHKDYSARLEYDIAKNISLGANFATTFIEKKNVGAFTGDLRTLHKISNRWEFETESSYAYGHNIVDFLSSKTPVSNMENYRMSGLYILPIARYRTITPLMKGLEFSCRWETLTENMDINPNPRNTLAPMVSFIFADNYAAKFSLIGVIDRYKTNMPGTSKYDQSRIMAQFQYRF